MKFSKVREVRTPNRGTPQSAGLDFYVPTGFDQYVRPGGKILIPTGIKVNIPKGTMFQVCNKSGISAKKGLLVGACIVDSDYQGEMHLNLWNVSNVAVNIASGTKLAQMILVPILFPTMEEVKEEDLFNEETQRGTGGFGSTGK
jgi:dUTP pyrophosphatase